MGDPRFPRKHFDTPSHPWQRQRIEREVALRRQYGLKNKREIWKANTRLRAMRRQARHLTAQAGAAQAQKETEQLLARLRRLALIEEGARLDDVLTIGEGALLDRRLQTQVYLQGFASSVKQARQMITHGHITVDGAAVRVPGMLVTREQEQTLAYSLYSPFANDMHPMRPRREVEPAVEEAPEVEPPREADAKPKGGAKPKDKPAKPKGEADAKPKDKPARPKGEADAKPKGGAKPKDKPAKPKGEADAKPKGGAKPKDKPARPKGEADAKPKARSSGKQPVAKETEA